MEHIMLMSHPGAEYTLWRYAATGSLITTVIASLIALPDNVTAFKSLYRHVEYGKRGR